MTTGVDAVVQSHASGNTNAVEAVEVVEDLVEETVVVVEDLVALEVVEVDDLVVVVVVVVVI